MTGGSPDEAGPQEISADERRAPGRSRREGNQGQRARARAAQESPADPLAASEEFPPLEVGGPDDTESPAGHAANADTPLPSRDAPRARDVGKKTKVGSLTDLWLLAYAKREKPLSVSKESLADLRPRDGELEEIRGLIAESGHHDAANWAPLRLLLAVLDSDAPREVRQRAAELASFALSEHAGLADLIESAATPVTAQKVLAVAQHHAETLELSADRARTAAENAARIYALLQALRGRWDSAAIARELADLIWVPSMLQSDKTFAAAAALVGATDREALGVLVRALRADTFQAERRAKRAEDESRRLTEEAARLRMEIEQAESHLAELETSLEGQRARIADLDALVDELRRRGEVDRSHLADDFETLRGEVLRRLANQVDLMTDGLHALRAGHTSIADEYVDRALRAISAEAARLKDLGGTQLDSGV